LVPEIHPSALSDLGLAEAFEEVADRSPLKVTILVDLEGRLPRVIEPAAYFIGAEALWQLMVKLYGGPTRRAASLLASNICPT
jgi:hypothetical protein